jgi:septin family protein
MKRFSKIVNIIPVIGKADTLSQTELQILKYGVRIKVYCLGFK